MPGGPAAPDLGAGPSSAAGPGSGGQPIAPVVPMEQAGQGYGGNRGPAYGGPRPVNGPVSLVGQPPAPGRRHAGSCGPGRAAGPGRRSPVSPVSRAGQVKPASPGRMRIPR